LSLGNVQFAEVTRASTAEGGRARPGFGSAASYRA
jgi:hypothetical protein